MIFLITGMLVIRLYFYMPTTAIYPKASLLTEQILYLLQYSCIRNTGHILHINLLTNRINQLILRSKLRAPIELYKMLEKNQIHSNQRVNHFNSSILFFMELQLK